MTPIRSKLSLLLLVSLLLTPACASLRSKTEKLNDSTFAYHNDVRWQRYRSAAVAIPLQRRETWVQGMQRAAKDMRIVEYDYRPVEVADDRAVYEVDLSFYRARVFVVERQKRRQVWLYLGSRWFLDSDREIIKPTEPQPGGFPDIEPADRKG